MAHEMRTPCAGKHMASKVHLMKFLQEVRGYDLVTNRRPAPSLSGLYLSQMRAHLNGTHAPARRKLSITVSPQDSSDTPSPVKIVQNAPATSACAVAR